MQSDLPRPLKVCLRHVAATMTKSSDGPQAPQRVRDEALEAGRTQEALWANFVRNNSLRR